MAVMLSYLQILSLLVLGPLCARAQFPCPEADDIKPCVCAVDAQTSKMDLTCNGIAKTDDLVEVFKATFPFNSMQNFIMNTDVTLTHLPQDIFGPITFEEVDILAATLDEMDDSIFDHMNDTIEVIKIHETELIKFPFERVSKWNKFTTLVLNSNNIGVMSDLVHPQMTNIDMSNNIGLYFGGDEFKKVPKLSSIKLHNVGLEYIPPDLFSMQNHANTVDLSLNSITYLETDVFNFDNGDGKNINLSNNQISIIDPGTFSSFRADFTVNLQNNMLEDLPEKVWKDVFDQAVNNVGSVNLKGNPILCGCNLKWLLVDNRDSLDVIDPASTCSDGTPLIDIDENILIANCP